jgi:hypothetical protein
MYFLVYCHFLFSTAYPLTISYHTPIQSNILNRSGLRSVKTYPFTTNFENSYKIIWNLLLFDLSSCYQFETFKSKSQIYVTINYPQSSLPR